MVRTCSMYVSFESRYGTCFSCCASEAMTVPSAESDLLIACVSLSAAPTAPDLSSRSEPARSTRCSFERRSVAAPTGRLSRLAVKTQCEREDVAFIVVSATARLVSPMKRRLSAY